MVQKSKDLISLKISQEIRLHWQGTEGTAAFQAGHRTNKRLVMRSANLSLNSSRALGRHATSSMPQHLRRRPRSQ